MPQAVFALAAQALLIDASAQGTAQGSCRVNLRRLEQFLNRQLEPTDRTVFCESLRGLAFTDLVYLDETTGRLGLSKVSTTPDDYSTEPFLEGGGGA